MNSRTSSSFNTNQLDLIFLDFQNYKEAAKLLSDAFEEDFFTQYSFHHIKHHDLSKFRYELNKQSLRRYLKNYEEYLCVGLRDNVNWKLVGVSIWKLPQDSKIFTKRNELIDLTTSEKRNFNTLKLLNNLRVFGYKGLKKMENCQKKVNLVYKEYLKIDANFYKLQLMAIDPGFQNKGYGSLMINDIFELINDDNYKFNNEKLSNCDYNSSKINEPMIIVETANHRTKRFYETLGFNDFVTVCYNDEELIKLTNSLSKEELSNNFKIIENKPNLKINILIKNRVPTKTFFVT